MPSSHLSFWSKSSSGTNVADVEPQPAGGFFRYDILSDIGWLCLEPLRENSMLVRCEEIDCTAC
jgi:hypothetical protein